MTARSTRRALTRSGASRTMLEEIDRLRKHNAALSMFLRGAIRAQGGALTIAKPYLEMPRDRIVGSPMMDRVILTLEPDAETADDPDMVPWSS